MKHSWTAFHRHGPASLQAGPYLWPYTGFQTFIMPSFF